MAYRLDLTDTLGEALRAVAVAQLDNAVTALDERWSASPAQAVHSARKSVKKTRALLRLARPALDPALYRRENLALRDAAAVLASNRDADVMVATTAKLAKRYVGHVPAATFEALTTAFAARAVEQRTSADGAGPRAEAIAALSAARERAADWPLEAVRRKTLVAAIARSYARGRAAFAAVAADDGEDAEASHEWRKRVKDLWYQQRLVAPAWPAILEAQAEAAHVLSELLGDDHDLAVLAAELRRGEIPAAADLAPVVEIVAHRHDELRQEALRLGARVYAERPKAFERRLRGYLELWLAEHEADRPAA